MVQEIDLLFFFVSTSFMIMERAPFDSSSSAIVFSVCYGSLSWSFPLLDHGLIVWLLHCLSTLLVSYDELGLIHGKGRLKLLYDITCMYPSEREGTLDAL